MPTTQRSDGLQCKIPLVISGGPWGWVLCSQVIHVAILILDTFLCQQPKLAVCACPQEALAAGSGSVSPIEQRFIWDQTPGTDVSFCHGQNHSLTGYRHVQELHESSACSSHRTFFCPRAVHGHPLGMAADRNARIVHFQPQGFQGNPTLQCLRAILQQFYINPSLHLLIFSCIECAFPYNNFCLHFVHTNSRSAQACCQRPFSLSVWFGCCGSSWNRPSWMP